MKPLSIVVKYFPLQIQVLAFLMRTWQQWTIGFFDKLKRGQFLLRLANSEIEIFLVFTPWKQDVTLTYIKCSEDVLDVFWTCHICSIFVLCPGGRIAFLMKLYPKVCLLGFDGDYCQKKETLIIGRNDFMRMVLFSDGIFWGQDFSNILVRPSKI